MPYIPEEERKEIEYSLNTLKAYLGISEDLPLGKLNYIVSTLISHLIETHGTSYTIGNNLIGCLLYTSPSPRDRQKSRMPSSA